MLDLARELLGVLAPLQALGVADYPVPTPGFVNPNLPGSIEDDAEQVAQAMNSAVATL